jgi:hypothetical protein
MENVVLRPGCCLGGQGSFVLGGKWVLGDRFEAGRADVFLKNRPRKKAGNVPDTVEKVVELENII